MERIDEELKRVIPKYYQVKTEIKSLILSGRIKTGEKIPSEHELAKKWNVNRWTVNKAINQLVNEGLLYRKKGDGTYVSGLKRRVITKNIGVLVYHIESPFCSSLVRGIEEKASELGYNLILCNTFGKEEKIKDIINSFIVKNKVDGIICPPENINSSFSDFPVVVVPQVDKEKFKNFNYVITDDEDGSYKAIKYLIKLGHKKIGFLTPKNWSETALLHRWNGYKKAMKENNLDIDKKLIIETKGPDFKDGWVSIDKIIEKINLFTAIFCVNDSLAIGVLKGLREKGIKVPDDISIVGFDNIPLSSHPDIQLTTVEQPVYRIGEKAVEILIENIEGKCKKPVHIILPTKLVIRKTTGKCERR